MLQTLMTDWAALGLSLWVTVKITLLAFALATVAGVLISFVFVQSKLIETALFPYAVLLQVTPIVAVAPLIIIWVKDPVLSMVICAALVALFLYALLPVVSNTRAGLDAVSPPVHDAAVSLGMTRLQILWQVELPLALPAILAATRIVLVQNIGLTVIAGLIGGGGFGSFVFQGLNQASTDMILLGALPTIFLAVLAGLTLDLAVEATGGTARGPA